METLLDLLASRDVYLNGQLRPEVIAGYEVINFICAAVADQIKQEGGDPFLAGSESGDILPEAPDTGAAPTPARPHGPPGPPHSSALWI